MAAPHPSYVRRLDRSETPSGNLVETLFDMVRASSLRRGDLVLCVAGDVIPKDGIVVAGRAAIGSDGDEDQKAAVALTGHGLRVREGMRLAAGCVVISVASE